MQQYQVITVGRYGPETHRYLSWAEVEKLLALLFAEDKRAYFAAIVTEQ